MTTAREDRAEDFSEVSRPSESRHDPAALERGLQSWLTVKLGPHSDVVVSDLRVPEANGMSNETVLFDAAWNQDGVREVHRLVARMAPGASAVPIFPVYDLVEQFETMRIVAANSPVPVPRVYWSEPSPEIMGDEFFIMERVDGDVPPDVMPYNFGSWLMDAEPEQRAQLQRSTVQVLADLHGIADPAVKFPLLRTDSRSETAAGSLRAHVDAQRAYYEWVVAGSTRSPLIERGFEWLEANWPEETGPSVFSWGDARIGNVIYQDFSPVGVLDWEMAALCPREFDLGWTIFMHRFFEDLVAMAGMPGMPDFLRREEVAAQYEEATGYTPRNLDFYIFYAAIRHAILMHRIQGRAIAFGQAQPPEDPDDMIMFRGTIEKMIDGVYWSELATRQEG